MGCCWVCGGGGEVIEGAEGRPRDRSRGNDEKAVSLGFWIILAYGRFGAMILKGLGWVG